MKGYRLNQATHDLEPIPGYASMLARRTLKASRWLFLRGVTAPFLPEIVLAHKLGDFLAHLRKERRGPAA